MGVHRHIANARVCGGERRAEYAEAAQDGEAHGWHSSGSIAPATRVHLETARSALCANDSPDIFFELSVNPTGVVTAPVHLLLCPPHAQLPQLFTGAGF